jgi:hypothetical protein
MVMTAATANDMYKNADHFGLMQLIDPDFNTSAVINNFETDVKIYPVPAQNYLTIETSSVNTTGKSVSILTITGQVMKNESFIEKSHTIHIEDLEAGTYIVNVIHGNGSFSKIITKQ